MDEAGSIAARCFGRLADLAGPIFAKELRVSSRRRRTYVIRVAYVAAMMLFLAIAWANVVGSGGISYQACRQSDVGRSVVVAVLTAQLIAACVLAAVSASTAIDEEIRGRMLPVLLTTPLTGVQIVLGKLLSRTWESVVLLALSLPALAVVRVWGGASWTHVVAGLAIALTAAILAAAMAIYFSLRGHAPANVVVVVVALGGLLYAAIPIPLPLAALLGGAGRAQLALAYVNPAAALFQVNAEGAGRTAGRFWWPVHCLLMLAAAGYLLRRSGAKVRGVGLAQWDRPRERTPPPRPRKRSPQSPRPVRRVVGPAMVWKETRADVIGLTGGRGMRRVRVVFMVIAWGIVHISLWMDARFGESGRGTSCVYMLLGAIGGLTTVAVISAGSIPAERMARTWASVLTTPLSDGAILCGKAVGAAYRSILAFVFVVSAPTMALLAGVVPTYVPEAMLLLPAMLCLVAASGLYFGAGTVQAGRAVAANIPFLAAVWILLPAFAPCCGAGAQIHPFVLIRLAAEPANTPGAAARIWLFCRALAVAAAHVGLAVLFFRAAARKMRKNVE